MIEGGTFGSRADDASSRTSNDELEPEPVLQPLAMAREVMLEDS